MYFIAGDPESFFVTWFPPSSAFKTIAVASPNGQSKSEGRGQQHAAQSGLEKTLDSLSHLSLAHWNSLWLLGPGY